MSKIIAHLSIGNSIGTWVELIAKILRLPIDEFNNSDEVDARVSNLSPDEIFVCCL